MLASNEAIYAPKSLRVECLCVCARAVCDLWVLPESEERASRGDVKLSRVDCKFLLCGQHLSFFNQN